MQANKAVKMSKDKNKSGKESWEYESDKKRQKKEDSQWRKSRKQKRDSKRNNED